MKRTATYLIIFLIICFLSDLALQNSLGQEIKNQSPYYLSFASIGANLLESRLDCWAKIKTSPTNKQLDQELQTILNSLDLPAADKNKILSQDNNDVIVSQYELNDNGISYQFILQTDKADQQSHLLMTATSLTGDIQLRIAEEKLKKVLDCNSYYSYKGLIDTRIDATGQEELLKIVMKCLKAQVNDVYQDNQVVSMSGFSPVLTSKVDVVKVAGKDCNVQAAIRCNSKDRKVEVFLGLPLLLNDY